MIRRSFGSLSALPLAAMSLTLAVPVASTFAQTGSPPVAEAEFARFSANQLDNLVGPIALYPDALLAQVLVASTFPDQVEDAARFVRANGTSGVDEQPWDVSVRAVAHYASAINMLADKIDWTATLGRAYANQSSDVMSAVQRMRALAARQGNLQTTPEQQVVNDGDTYVISPRQSRVIYVPVYDPILVYERPIFEYGVRSRYWSFGVGFPIGGWLMYDVDWRARNVYYNGWGDAYLEYGGGWRARALPFIQISNVYVTPRYRTVYYNRDVWRRPINYGNVDRLGGYHRETYFDNHHVVGIPGRSGDTRSTGDYRNGNERGGDNRGGDIRGGDNRGGNNRGADNRGGDNRGGVIRGNDGETPRTTQPRDRGTASPDGYRNGSDRNSAPRETRPPVSAPDRRRNEPTGRANDAVVVPDANRGAPRNEPRGEPRSEPRREAPRQEAPRQEAPRVSAPRNEQPRQEAPRATRGDGGGGGGRTAAPRGDRGGDKGGDRGGDRGRRGN